MADEIIIEIGAEETIAIEVNEPALVGSGDSIVSKIAGATLSGHRAVVLDTSGEAIYADKDTVGHASCVLGITTGAAPNGEVVHIQRSGEIEESGWTWTAQAPVYLGSNGALSQTPPTTGFSIVIGFAIDSTTLFITIGEPILL